MNKTSRKASMIAAGVVLASLATCLSAPKAWAVSFSGVYTFGDSLADPGNLFRELGGAGPSGPPYYEGRFSNGPVYVEHLTNRLGLDPSNPANGINYAFGGARSGFDHTELPFIPGTLGQIGIYGQQFGGVADPNALYVISTGSNDYSDLLDLYSAPSGQVKARIRTTVRNINTAVNTLAAMGAKNFLVINVPSFGVLPGITNDPSLPPDYIDFANQVSGRINLRLQGSLKRTEELADVNISDFRLSYLLKQAIKNPERFGLTNATDACLYTEAPPFTACDEYLFWDGTHPTAYAHEVLAQRIFQRLNSNHGGGNRFAFASAAGSRALNQVPEPTTLLGSAVFAAAGLFMKKKRDRQNQQRKALLGVQPLPQPTKSDVA
jgi:phospholipase/lecithinase/hemolysin